MSPRRRSDSSYAAQFRTRYLVLYFGVTLLFLRAAIVVVSRGLASKSTVGLGGPEGQEVEPCTNATLRKQYRMHPSLSAVPRELFYFGEALHDGRVGGGADRIQLLPVERTRHGVEDNEDEADKIGEILTKLNCSRRPGAEPVAFLRGARPGAELAVPGIRRIGRLVPDSGGLAAG